ncbi:hypothetical protein C6Y14_39990 [Streptomyces dioscori]|uniref:Guanylate cyclase domain-containing protein n=1 Tax=Streptomyces dioscori TaxID=2109333 RepID=A0A2P8PUY3_9ACTN|nr:hypothetical protein [Streptomyces dioscori]PSM37814.1 hypothetical protein C6Y14_39990 [Streptomyces dioscori]
MVSPDPHSYWIVLLDIEDFSLRTEVAQATLHGELYEVVEFALARAGLDLAECPVQDRGDGMLILIPMGTSPTKLLREVARGLEDALQAHQVKYNQDHRMRLRVGLNQGLVIRQGERWTGTAINDLARLVDAGPVKGVLEQARRAQLVLVVSENVHTSIVRGGYPGIDPASYLSADFVTKHGELRRGWITVPGYSSPPGLPADSGTPPGAAGGTAVRDGAGAGTGDGGTVQGSTVPPSTPMNIRDVSNSRIVGPGAERVVYLEEGDYVEGGKYEHRHYGTSADGS